jgi:hypothetical protein
MLALWDDDAEWRRVDAALDDARSASAGARSPGRASSGRAVTRARCRRTRACRAPSEPTRRGTDVPATVDHAQSRTRTRQAVRIARRQQRLRRAAGRRRHPPHPRRCRGRASAPARTSGNNGGGGGVAVPLGAYIRKGDDLRSSRTSCRCSRWRSRSCGSRDARSAASSVPSSADEVDAALRRAPHRRADAASRLDTSRPADRPDRRTVRRGKSTLARGCASGGRARSSSSLSTTLPRVGRAGPGGHAREFILDPLAAGRGRTWRRWDWAAMRPGADDDTADVPLILEGCGALTAASARPRAVRVWLESPRDARRGRSRATARPTSPLGAAGRRRRRTPRDDDPRRTRRSSSTFPERGRVSARSPGAGLERKPSQL